MENQKLLPSFQYSLGRSDTTLLLLTSVTTAFSLILPPPLSSLPLHSQRTVMRAMSRRRRASVKAKVKPGARKLLTVSAHFRQSLELLMERVFAASPHFVRCVSSYHLSDTFIIFIYSYQIWMLVV